MNVSPLNGALEDYVPSVAIKLTIKTMELLTSKAVKGRDKVKKGRRMNIAWQCAVHKYPHQSALTNPVSKRCFLGGHTNTEPEFVPIHPTQQWALWNWIHTCYCGIGFFLEYSFFLFQQLFHLYLVLPLHLLNHPLMTLLHAAEAKFTGNLTHKQGYIHKYTQ